MKPVGGYEDIPPMIHMLPIDIVLGTLAADVIQATSYILLGSVVIGRTYLKRPLLLRSFWLSLGRFVLWCGIGHALCLMTLFIGGWWWVYEMLSKLYGSAVTLVAVLGFFQFARRIDEALTPAARRRACGDQ